MHIDWARIVAYPVVVAMFAIIIGIADAIIRRIPRATLLGRLIAAERRWSWKRGGNWWRGGIPPGSLDAEKPRKEA